MPLPQTGATAMQTRDEKRIDWQPTGRSTRWYEWLLILLLLGLAGGVRAETVYKCTNAHGDVAYQSQPCAGDQHATIIEIPPPPPLAPSPHYAVDHERAERTSAGARRARSGGRREAQPMSYECRAADGRVFYRHGSCPHSIPAGSVRGGVATTHARGGSRRVSGTTVSVSAQRIPREEACYEIQRAGAAGRAGHEHDEVASAYEHNLGRDPCR